MSVLRVSPLLLLLLSGCEVEPDADADGDGFVESEDCDDDDASVYPGAAEICDSVDNDCDGTVDEDLDEVWYVDEDGDGYGYQYRYQNRCTQPSGYVLDSTDCDDEDASANPGATETCDGVDNDCDGTVDGSDATDQGTWYADVDGDSYGDPGSPVTDCTQPSGYVDDSTDCDDTDASAYPGGTEICDGVDNDCDGTVDGADATDQSTWYADADGDGYGESGTEVEACDQPSGFVSESDDCDDDDGDTWPGATEYCNGQDDDCDGDIDEDSAADAVTWYADSDGDGYGDPGDSDVECYEPSGYVSNSVDCDDSDSALNQDDVDSDGYSTCDDDCDDNDSALDSADSDGDGYSTCDDDCDDGDDGTWPGSAEAESSTDCMTDADDDGWGESTPASGVSAGIDCDDSDASLNLDDADSDGLTSCDGDCDDTAATAYPGATEYCDNLDNDCDGTVDEDDAVDATTWYADSDSDGYGDSGSTTQACSQPSGYVSDATDCDDSVATTYPGATENCDTVDDDCDGTAGVDDVDGDGWASCEECNDDDAGINPDATEICDSGADEDCNGLVDCEDAACASSSSSCFESVCDDNEDDDDDGLVDCVDDDCAGIGDCMVIVSQVSDGMLKNRHLRWGSVGSASGSSGAHIEWSSTSYADALVAQSLTGTMKVYENSAVQTCVWGVGRMQLDRSSFGAGPTSSLARSGFATSGGCGLSSFFLPQALVASSGWALTASAGLPWYAVAHPQQGSNLPAPLAFSGQTSSSYGGWGGGWNYQYTSFQSTFSWRVSSPWYVKGSSYSRSVPCNGDPNAVASNWYLDSDGDGYGDPNEEVLACQAPSAYVADNSDSDDWDSGVH